MPFVPNEINDQHYKYWHLIIRFYLKFPLTEKIVFYFKMSAKRIFLV